MIEGTKPRGRWTMIATNPYEAPRSSTTGLPRKRPPPQWPGAIALRVVVAIQLLCVLLAGAICRGWYPASLASIIQANETFLLTMAFLPLPVFPVAVIVLVRLSHLPEWKQWVIGMVETALCYAHFLAILPAIQ